MKIRTGFVSNSSSSSFICDTCGETFEGMDLCPTDAEHYECCNGHIFCDKEVLGEVDEDLDEYITALANANITKLSTKSLIKVVMKISPRKLFKLRKILL